MKSSVPLLKVLVYWLMLPFSSIATSYPCATLDLLTRQIANTQKHRFHAFIPVQTFSCCALLKSYNLCQWQCYVSTWTCMQTPRRHNSWMQIHPRDNCYRVKHTELYSSISEPSISLFPNWERITNHQTSKTVKIFKSIHRANKSKRLKLGMTVAEGVRLVTDILENEESRKLVRRLVVSEDLLEYICLVDDSEKSQRLEHWLRVLDKESAQRKLEYNDGGNQNLDRKFCIINIGTKQVVEACAGTVTTQGVVALMDIPRPYHFTLDSPKVAPFYLILDGLADPGNVGTLLRSCAAARVDALILLPDSCDVFNPKAVRSAMGATFRVPVLDLGDSRLENTANEEVTNLDSFDRLLHYLRQCGIASDRVFAATMEESGVSFKPSIPHYKVNWMHQSESDKPAGAALILGKEGEGLRQEVRNAITQGTISMVHVPMAPGIESLNAAICGSVIMFERMRQLLLLEGEEH